MFLWREKTVTRLRTRLFNTPEEKRELLKRCNEYGRALAPNRRRNLRYLSENECFNPVPS